ncbi:hypothetical protein GCM10020331_054970 [Ectobacillus funiculus]
MKKMIERLTHQFFLVIAAITFFVNGRDHVPFVSQPYTAVNTHEKKATERMSKGDLSVSLNIKK